MADILTPQELDDLLERLDDSNVYKTSLGSTQAQVSVATLKEACEIVYKQLDTYIEQNFILVDGTIQSKATSKLDTIIQLWSVYSQLKDKLEQAQDKLS